MHSDQTKNPRNGFRVKFDQMFFLMKTQNKNKTKTGVYSEVQGLDLLYNFN